MKIATYNVVIDRDVMSKIGKQIWAWELPVLESKFPGGLARVVSSETVDRDSLPDADQEYIRLQGAYGADENGNQSHVSLAYDRGEKGIELLKKAIAEAANGEKSVKKYRSKIDLKGKTESIPQSDPDETEDPEDPLS